MQGADASQGPGWWQASDGKWYPPEAQPGAVPTAQTAAPAPGSGYVPPSGPEARGVEGGSFFKRLFDISLTTFITPSIIKLLYVLAIIGVSLATLAFLAGGFASIGPFVLILAPIFWLVGVIYWRVVLELVIVLFRIERNTRNDR